MVGALAHDDKRDQARPGNPARDGFGGNRWAGHAVAAFRAGVFGQDMNFHLEPRRDEIELAGLVFADAGFGTAAARAGLLLFWQIVRNTDVGEMIEPGPARGSSRCRPLRGYFVGRRGRGRLGLFKYLGNVEKMTLAWVVNKALAAPAENVATKQCQGLG